jgi:15-cis-phytoene synthase
MKTVYAFCRKTDDLVDNDLDVGRKVALLQTWRDELELAVAGTSSYSMLNQLCSLAERFHIPVAHFHELIRGVEMDLVRDRYETFDELREYCYLVASSVGLMTLQIFGSKHPSTKEYAVNLGIALQLTNIIRDVGVDAASGRIYIPAEDMRKHGCREEDILARRYTPEFRSLMEFEARRAEAYFDAARSALAPSDRKAMFAAKIMERIYYHTLRKIRKCDYDVLNGEIRIPSLERLLIAIKYWVRDRILAP